MVAVLYSHDGRSLSGLSYWTVGLCPRVNSIFLDLFLRPSRKLLALPPERIPLDPISTHLDISILTNPENLVLFSYVLRDKCGKDVE